MQLLYLDKVCQYTNDLFFYEYIIEISNKLTNKYFTLPIAGELKELLINDTLSLKHKPKHYLKENLFLLERHKFAVISTLVLIESYAFNKTNRRLADIPNIIKKFLKKDLQFDYISTKLSESIKILELSNKMITEVIKYITKNYDYIIDDIFGKDYFKIVYAKK
ncbi:MAG: hypothetical protein ACRCYE_11970 [Sarcina sp.]